MSSILPTALNTIDRGVRLGAITGFAYAAGALGAAGNSQYDAKGLAILVVSAKCLLVSCAHAEKQLSAKVRNLLPDAVSTSKIAKGAYNATKLWAALLTGEQIANQFGCDAPFHLPVIGTIGAVAGSVGLVAASFATLYGVGTLIYEATNLEARFKELRSQGEIGNSHAAANKAVAADEAIPAAEAQQIHADDTSTVVQNAA